MIWCRAQLPDMDIASRGNFSDDTNLLNSYLLPSLLSLILPMTLASACFKTCSPFRWGSAVQQALSFRTFLLHPSTSEQVTNAFRCINLESFPSTILLMRVIAHGVTSLPLLHHLSFPLAIIYLSLFFPLSF